ncbi:MAG: efflux RND transporter periplasmic adaptor subunit [Pirellulales bacterium]
MLRSQNAVAEEELQTLLSAVKVAEARYASALNSVHSNIALVAVRTAEVDLARQHISDAHITSPFNGYVQARHVAAGMYVQIGTPLMTIVRVDTLRFRGSLPERMAGELQIGDSISLRVESIPDPIAAKVSRITPALDMTSRSLAFEAQIDNRDGKLERRSPKRMSYSTIKLKHW